MFSFCEDDVDFFLPQLLTLYVNIHDVAEATHQYIVHRCSLLLIALLTCAHMLTLLYASDASASVDALMVVVSSKRGYVVVPLNSSLSVVVFLK